MWVCSHYLISKNCIIAKKAEKSLFKAVIINHMWSLWIICLLFYYSVTCLIVIVFSFAPLLFCYMFNYVIVFFFAPFLPHYFLFLSSSHFIPAFPILSFFFYPHLILSPPFLYYLSFLSCLITRLLSLYPLSSFSMLLSSLRTLYSLVSVSFISSDSCPLSLSWSPILSKKQFEMISNTKQVIPINTIQRPNAGLMLANVCYAGPALNQQSPLFSVTFITSLHVVKDHQDDTGDSAEVGSAPQTVHLVFAWSPR